MRHAVALALLLAATEGGAQAIYKNENFDYIYKSAKFGYTVSFPVHWQPSGISYSNAFEIRNYDPQAPESVPERNRASVIVVDTINETAAATETFLNGLDTSPSPSVEHLRIDTHRAVRVVERLPVQELAPGTATPPSGKERAEAKFILAIDLYIANGKHLLSVQARVPVEADATVRAEIAKIEDSVRFQNTKGR